METGGSRPDSHRLRHRLSPTEEWPSGRNFGRPSFGQDRDRECDNHRGRHFPQ